MKYQVTKALPWWFKRWVLFRKSARLEPLYQFDEPDSEGSIKTDGGHYKATAELRENVTRPSHDAPVTSERREERKDL